MNPNEQPLILVTNDDGITSPGIHALARAVAALGEVVVIAPDQNWSISGHQKAINKFLRADPYPSFPHGITAYACSGAPADCVAIGLMGLLPHRPTLVVSGVNHGPNMGQDITYSGTVAAAFEATIMEVPAVAVSLDVRGGQPDFSDAAAVGAQVARQVLAQGLPHHTLINVNVPRSPAHEWKGIRVTRLGVRAYADELIIGQDPQGRPFYWVHGSEPQGDTSSLDTDIGAVHAGYVAITPLQMDMTSERLLGRLREWQFG